MGGVVKAIEKVADVVVEGVKKTVDAVVDRRPAAGGSGHPGGNHTH